MNTNNTFVACALLIVLAGCASPMGLRQGEVGNTVLDEMSDKSAQQVAACVGDKLEAETGTFTTFGALGTTNFSTRPTTNGYSISGIQSTGLGGTDTVILIDLIAAGEKTRVKMYTHYLVGKGPEGLFTAVRGCL